MSVTNPHILYTVRTEIQFWTTFLLTIFAENEANKSYVTFSVKSSKSRNLTDSVSKLKTYDSKHISCICIVLLYIFLIVQYIANILLGITKERVLPFLHSSVVVLKHQWQKLIFQKFTNAGNISHSWQKMINLPTSTVY